MASKYTYQPHPHVENRKERGPATSRNSHKSVKGPTSAIAKFNNRLGFRITKSVGTMWAAYLFFALSLVSLPSVLQTGNAVIIVGWIAQTFLQLVLLPIIIVGQNIQAEASDARAIATYDDAGAILEEAKEIQNHLANQDQALGELIEKVAALEAKLALADRGGAGDSAVSKGAAASKRGAK
jgi:phage-related minor tail protein